MELILHNEEIRVIWDSAGSVLGVYSGKDIIIETQDTISLKCTDFILDASENIDIQAGSNANLKSGMATAVNGGQDLRLKAQTLTIN